MSKLLFLYDVVNLIKRQQIDTPTDRRNLGEYDIYHPGIAKRKKRELFLAREPNKNISLNL